MSRANRAEIQRKLLALERQAKKQALREGLVAGVRQVAAEISRDAPRDTGHLAGTIRVRAGSATARVLTASVTVGDPQGEPVAFWQEFGTADMPAHPFIRPAVIDGTPRIIDRVEAAARDALR